ncbi:UNVERIFIED_CONTAM: hypothetical protein Sradi_0105700 [Sesamum radiatum]|uniref:Uncharacterized protein n=1 Tax=Sesamum radiatum TaxID=300843 RepID=A0AAW2WJH9_SESRA
MNGPDLKPHPIPLPKCNRRLDRQSLRKRKERRLSRSRRRGDLVVAPRSGRQRSPISSRGASIAKSVGDRKVEAEACGKTERRTRRR